MVGRLIGADWPVWSLTRTVPPSERDIKAPSRKFLPLQAAPGLVDGWLRPRIQVHEHRLLPEATHLLAAGRIAVEGRRVRILPA